MPNAKALSEKQAIVAGLTEKMKAASAGILVDYKGITVELDTKLRSMLRESNVEYAVVKNTLTRFAAKEVGLDGLDPMLNGTTALAMSAGDPILPARLLTEFTKKNKTTLTVKAGFVEGTVVSPAQIDALAGNGQQTRAVVYRSWYPERAHRGSGPRIKRHCRAKRRFSR